MMNPPTVVIHGNLWLKANKKFWTFVISSPDGGRQFDIDRNNHATMEKVVAKSVSPFLLVAANKVSVRDRILDDIYLESFLDYL